MTGSQQRLQSVLCSGAGWPHRASGTGTRGLCICHQLVTGVAAGRGGSRERGVFLRPGQPPGEAPVPAAGTGPLARGGSQRGDTPSVPLTRFIKEAVVFLGATGVALALLGAFQLPPHVLPWQPVAVLLVRLFCPRRLGSLVLVPGSELGPDTPSARSVWTPGPGERTSCGRGILCLRKPSGHRDPAHPGLLSLDTLVWCQGGLALSGGPRQAQGSVHSCRDSVGRAGRQACAAVGATPAGPSLRPPACWHLRAQDTCSAKEGGWRGGVSP